jgi:hypothetical protein
LRRITLKSPALRGFTAQRPESEANGVERRVGRSRYAEESRAVAPRIILHLHPLNPEGMILQYFVRIDQHEDNDRRAL